MALRLQACHPYHAAPALHRTPGMHELQVGAIHAGISATFDDIEALAAQVNPPEKGGNAVYFLFSRDSEAGVLWHHAAVYHSSRTHQIKWRRVSTAPLQRSGLILSDQ
jgi:hypothetical protein